MATDMETEIRLNTINELEKQKSLVIQLLKERRCAPEERLLVSVTRKAAANDGSLREGVNPP